MHPEQIDPLSGPPADRPVRLPSSRVELVGLRRIGPFEFQWPGDTESFEGGWVFEAHIDGSQHSVRLGIGAREAFGRLRVHAVTWMDGQVQVEGAEADHYPAIQALIGFAAPEVGSSEPGPRFRLAMTTLRSWSTAGRSTRPTARSALRSRSARTTWRPGLCTLACAAS